MLFGLMGLSLNTTAQTGGLRFLTLGTGPSQLASGESFVAGAPGAMRLFANPALNALAYGSELDISHGYWIGEATNSAVAFTASGAGGRFGLGVRASGVGGIEARQTPGPAAGDLVVDYLALTAGYARTLAGIGVGVNAHYLFEQVADRRATGLALDAGLAAAVLDGRLRLGAALRNSGSMDADGAQASPVPSELRFGADADLFSFTVAGSGEIPLLVGISGDFISPNDASAYTAMGLRLSVADVIDLRGGWQSGDTVRPLSGGIDIRYGRWRFGYAVVPFESGFGTTHTLGAGIRF